jgi:hypothetical protein
MREKTVHPYKTTGKIMVLYIFILRVHGGAGG